eukprot:764957-Hanusia_phi.AAC.1
MEFCHPVLPEPEAKHSAQDASSCSTSKPAQSKAYMFHFRRMHVQTMIVQPQDTPDPSPLDFREKKIGRPHLDAMVYPPLQGTRNKTVHPPKQNFSPSPPKLNMIHPTPKTEQYVNLPPPPYYLLPARPHVV